MHATVTRNERLFKKCPEISMRAISKSISAEGVVGN